MQIASIVFAILAVGALIILHEAGHFFVARWSGMSVRRFSIGFGPSIATVRYKGTDFQISLIPLGGFVQIDGMSPHDGTDPNAPGSYQTRPFHQKFATILAGPAANYLLGFFMLVLLFTLFHFESRPPIRLTRVVEGSAAAKAGLKEGDLLVGTSSAAFTSEQDFRDAIQVPGELSFRLRRDGQERLLSVTPDDHDGHRVLGVTFEGAERVPAPLSVGRAAQAAGMEVLAITVGTVVGLASLFKPKSQVELSGPIGIVRGLSERAQRSLSDALGDVARLSVAVGLFNLFPIPALDGSRLIFLLVGMVRRKPIEPRLEQVIHLVGMALLLGLFVVISIGDVLR